jgi:hypothetical protein
VEADVRAAFRSGRRRAARASASLSRSRRRTKFASPSLARVSRWPPQVSADELLARVSARCLSASNCGLLRLRTSSLSAAEPRHRQCQDARIRQGACHQRRSIRTIPASVACHAAVSRRSSRSTETNHSCVRYCLIKSFLCCVAAITLDAEHIPFRIGFMLHRSTNELRHTVIRSFGYCI